jgi:hypothetical protein
MNPIGKQRIEGRLDAVCAGLAGMSSIPILFIVCECHKLLFAVIPMILGHDCTAS